MTTRNGAQNGASSNGSNNNKPSALVLNTPSKMVPAEGSETGGQMIRAEVFDQPVVLQQTNLWSRGILYTILGLFTFGIVWASLAKIQEAVPAQGQLKPQGQVRPVQAPVAGVVQEIFVKEGQAVKKGDLLLRFDPTAATAQKKSLEQVRTTLQQENQFYRSVLAGQAAPVAALGEARIPPEMLSLAANRTALQSEIQLYRAQLSGSSGAGLTNEQAARVQSGVVDSNARAAAAQFDVAQLQQQLSQAESELASNRQSLAIDERIYNDLKSLAEEGGISRLQFLNQEQRVIDSRSKVDKLMQEQQRLQYAIAGAREKLYSTVAVSSNDLLTKIGENDKQIANLDSQLNKAIVENDKQIAQIASQLSQAEVTLKYSDMRAPVDGIVFDLQAKGAGFVASTTEPILKIVPENGLIAEVYVTNKDIGFIKVGMPVDVRIDSFPFSEFGDIQGKLVQIGSDALPPDQEHNYYRFPVKVELQQQTLPSKNQGQDITLQSGMSLTANIVTRHRTVISIFTDHFTKKMNSIETVR